MFNYDLRNKKCQDYMRGMKIEYASDAYYIALNAFNEAYGMAFTDGYMKGDRDRLGAIRIALGFSASEGVG